MASVDAGYSQLVILIAAIITLSRLILSRKQPNLCIQVLVKSFFVLSQSYRDRAP